MDQRSGHGRLIGRVKNTLDQFMERISALNKIIRIPSSKKKVSLEEQKKDRFLRGRQIAFIICDYFLVIGAHDKYEYFRATGAHDAV